jgi:hypothetical protein
MTTALPTDQARDWREALEDLETIHGAFVGLSLLLRNLAEPLDAYQLAKVTMIIEILTARFEVLLDTAVDGMMAERGQATHRPPAVPHAPEGADA